MLIPIPGTRYTGIVPPSVLQLEIKDYIDLGEFTEFHCTGRASINIGDRMDGCGNNASSLRNYLMGF